ncbi:MAG TPA: ChbG/HpnK family deacetylase [Gaiellaceae bacterium]|nr:ChbG/HpnK family deacetylase [Gaiellaceae bacterium]
MAEPARYLIVNADDFGSSRGVDRGIVEAHESGIVTSASLMVERPAAEEAARYARRRRELGVGLHFELEAKPRRRLSRRWSRRTKLPSEDELRRRAQAQLDRFRELMGEEPSHLDSHHHVHRREPARSVAIELSEQTGVPLRELHPRIRFCGDFYGQLEGRPWPEGILPGTLVELLESLPAGITELGCHPGYADDLDTWYRKERAQEIVALCDPEVRRTIDRLGIELVTFRDVTSGRLGG